MTNWCANRLVIHATEESGQGIADLFNGKFFPFYQDAIKKSIRIFLLGYSGVLKPIGKISRSICPQLVSWGMGKRKVRNDSFGLWLRAFEINAKIDESLSCHIRLLYRGIADFARNWEEIPEHSRDIIAGVLLSQGEGWFGRERVTPFNPEEIWDWLGKDYKQEPSGDFDWRAIYPTRLASEIYGVNGALSFAKVLNRNEFFEKRYGTSPLTPVERIEFYDPFNLEIDFDSKNSPLKPAVLSTFSRLFNCEVDHYFAEQNQKLCGHRFFEKGKISSSRKDKLVMDEVQEGSAADIMGFDPEPVSPEYIIGNVAHYGG
jgi:hypothetical protein